MKVNFEVARVRIHGVDQGFKFFHKAPISEILRTVIRKGGISTEGP